MKPKAECLLSQDRCIKMRRRLRIESEKREEEENGWPEWVRQNPARRIPWEWKEGRASIILRLPRSSKTSHHETFRKDLLSTHCVAGIVLATGNTADHKMGTVCPAWSFTRFVTRSLLILANAL